jgi:photosystem II stability/assembly factor-like uncharacterized protein
LFKSTNGGTNWTAINTGLTNTFVNALAINPQTPDTLYAGTDGGGLFKSTNGGTNWTATGLTSNTVYALAIDPQTPDTLYAGTDGGGVFKSTNGGTNWTAINTGLTSNTVNALAINPQTPDTLYAGTDGGGVFKTTDGETNWTAINTGLTNTFVNALAINPQTPDTLYAGTDGGGVFKTTDGGTNWTAINTGLTNTFVNALAINPQTPETVYAGTYYSLSKSTNGGTNWTATGLKHLQFYALAINPQTPETLYAGTYGGGVFKTTNGGTSWTAMNTGLTDTFVYALAINPQTPDTLYAGTEEGGVFKTTNGGTNWTAMNTGLTNTHVNALAINPQTPETLYGGTYGGGVFKTTNGGTSWTAMNTGLTNTHVNALAINPQTPDTPYAGTYGGGVFKFQQVTEYTLTVLKSGTGSGTVTSNPSDIDCGSDCTETYNQGTSVTLTAIPASGSTFGGWSGDADCSDGVVVMNANMTCTATFNPQVVGYTLTVIKSGTGNGTVTSNPAGINCASDCTEGYNPNTVVTLTATPASGSTFEGWSGACSGTGECSVTMDADETVTATFNQQQHTLTVAKVGTGSGTVTSSPAGINCGDDCSETYDQGTSVTLTATPASGCIFTGWSGACSGTGACTVTTNAAKSVTATFNLQGAGNTLTVSKTGTGTGTVTSSPAGINCGDDCSETYSKVQKVKLTAKADASSTFTGWSGGGCSGTKTCTVTVDGSVTVTVDFALKTPDISVAQTSIEFGSIKVGKKATKTLKIMNNGTGDLMITLSGLEGTDFSIQGSSNVRIKSKKSYTLKVLFTPKSAGSKTATLEIESNDPDTKKIDISLIGTGQ